MPDMVLVHIGCTSGPFITTTRPPAWLEDTVKQYFTFNNDNLYIMTDEENIPYLPQHSKVIPVVLEDYYSDKIDRFHAVYEHAPRDFWTICATRFMYLENFMRDNDLKHIYHADNDVLIYFNLAESHNTFQRLYPGIAITPESPYKASALFMYIDNYKALAGLTDFFIEELERHGESGLMKKHSTDVIHEMLLISAYSRKYKDRVKDLPILPFGGQSVGIDEFGAIFDPGSWGEVVDGTRLGKSVGHHAPNAYVSLFLKEHPGYVVWRKDDGLWCPYLNCNGRLTKINSLHMHSKNLSSFLSKDGSLNSYWAKLYHNYHELSASERRRYEQKDRAGLSIADRFFFEGCLPIPGEMYKADRKALYDAIIEYKPAHCFEIGTGYGGGSTFFLTSAFAKLGRGKVITLEKDTGGGALRNYQRFLPGLLPFVEFLTGSDPALFLPFIEDRVECVFLDGSDDSEETLRQYEFFEPFFMPGSIIMAHDWNTAKMQLLRPVIDNDPNWTIEIKLDEPESVGFIATSYQPIRIIT